MNPGRSDNNKTPAKSLLAHLNPKPVKIPANLNVRSSEALIALLPGTLGAEDRGTARWVTGKRIPFKKCLYAYTPLHFGILTPQP